MNENKDSFFTSLRKDLEKDLNYLKKENKDKITENEKKIKDLEAKLKSLYYWLFGIALVFLLIIGVMFFYLRNLVAK